MHIITNFIEIKSMIYCCIQLLCNIIIQLLKRVFLKSSASVWSIPFLSFIESIFAWNVPLVSLISLNRSLAIPIRLFPSISLHCSLKKILLSLLAVLWITAFSWEYLFPLPLCFSSFLHYFQASSDTYFAFLHLVFFGIVLVTASCKMLPLSIVHQGLYQI